MTSRAITRTAGMCGLLLLLAACGGSSGGSSTGAQPAGAPTNGGTLKLLGSGDVDHLDPASAYYTVTYTLERAFTRQLVSYPASSDITTATTVAADLVAHGLSNTAIATRLFLSEKTVRNRVSDVLTKLHAASRAEAVALARDAGLGPAGQPPT